MNWVDILQGLGSVATAIGSVATAIALFYVALSTAHAKKAAEAAEQQLNVERVRDEERRQELSRAQAHQVSTWPARRLGSDGPWGVAIANVSNGPIYDVAVTRSHSVTQGGIDIDAINVTLKVVPPGLYFVKPHKGIPEMPKAVSRAELEPIFKNRDFCAELTFRDSMARAWRRLPDRTLAHV
ncbi:hypothetical protein [Sinomonas sp. ASV322]|uniref:hypothetical protein n=1 Tax=Sinomonas sp. ASV322 TaxID=3041920 RepID=UPI0027DBCF01|nr:hypothetical protein [Sinomonas sp. ASV322]MDQ4504305.1 hypothetical protein [Sinomonas sp. ASV322]